MFSFPRIRSADAPASLFEHPRYRGRLIFDRPVEKLGMCYSSFGAVVEF